MGQFTPAVCLGLAGWDPMYNAGSGNTQFRPAECIVKYRQQLALFGCLLFELLVHKY